MKVHQRMEVQLHAFLTLALQRGEWTASQPWPLYTPGERATRTQMTGDWVGLRDGVNVFCSSIHGQ